MNIERERNAEDLNPPLERTEQQRLFFISVRSVRSVANVQFLRT